MTNGSVRVLVAGWFSFSHGHATAGDLLARDLACEWLAAAGFAYDVGLAPPFAGGVNWQNVRPEDYTHVVFVCGPFQQGALEQQFLRHFAGCRLIGLDLSMLTALDQWSPFDVLLERDSSATSRPDVVFLSRQPLVPVVGRCLVEPYDNSYWNLANEAVARLLAARSTAVVEIDTRLDVNSTGLRTPAEIESLIARVDVLVTTRLHGLVLALKNGVPAIAIDPMGDGAKILRQAATIGWPLAYAADQLNDAELQHAFDYCLTGDARAKAIECGERARRMIAEMPGEFLAGVTNTSPVPRDGFGESTGPPRATLTATPSSIQVVGASQAGMTTLEWSSKGTDTVEVRVGAPEGPLLSRSGPSGSATTGKWVSDGMTFFLQDVSAGLPLTPENTLATVAVNVTSIESLEGRPPVGHVQFGGLRRLTPISRQFGYDRGRPIDRYYIETFLSRRSYDIRARVLEIGDDSYTRQFGSLRVTHSDVLHVSRDNPNATIVGDLASADHIESDAFDCVILTQTLHLIYDVRAALVTLHRILRPGGVLLATFPGLSQIADTTWKHTWHWGFTTASARRIFAETFPGSEIQIEAWGNVLAATAFLHGLAEEELRPEELDYQDPEYEVLITIRAMKPPAH